VEHACKASTREAEAGGSQFQGQPGYISKNERKKEGMGGQGGVGQEREGEGTGGEEEIHKISDNMALGTQQMLTK
jgi:hypothetical protein